MIPRGGDAETIRALRDRLDEALETIRQLREADTSGQWRGLRLTPAQRHLLGLLVSARPAVTRDFVLSRRDSLTSNSVNVIICHLRKKLAALDPPIEIQTAWGVGYYMTAENKAALAARQMR